MASLSTAPVSAPEAPMAGIEWRRFLPWEGPGVHYDALTTALIGAIWFGLGLLFLTPGIVTTSTVFPFIVGKALWSHTLIEIIAGLYVLLAIRAPEFRPARSALVLLFGLHVAALVIAGALGNSFNLSFWSTYERMGGIFDLAHWFVLAAVLVFAIRDLRQWKILVAVYLAVSWYSMSVAVAERFDHQWVGYIDYDRSLGRIGGSAGNPAFLAGQMLANSMLSAALFAGTFRSTLRSRRLMPTVLLAFYGLTAFVSVWTLTETGTRGSMAGLLAGLAVIVGLYALFSDRRRVRILAIGIGVAVPAAMILLFIGRDTAFVEDLAARNAFVQRVVSASGGAQSLGQRAIGLRIAGQAFVASPVAGWGGENFEVAYQRYRREGELSDRTPLMDRAHNKPLDLLATSGLIGFTSYMAMWGWIGFLALRRVRNEPDERLLHATVSGALVAMFIHNLFLFDTASTLLVFSLFTAWAAAGERSRNPEQPSGRSRLRLPGGVSRSFRWAAPVLVGIVVVLGVYGINWRIYTAAQLVTETGSTVEEVADNLDHFPPLATFGRERLLNVMSDRWEELDPFERPFLIPKLEEQANLALAAEPNNMELHFAVARFYRAASVNEPGFVELARFHTDRAAELGPETPSTFLALETQEMLESGVWPPPKELR